MKCFKVAWQWGIIHCKSNINDRYLGKNNRYLGKKILIRGYIEVHRGAARPFSWVLLLQRNGRMQYNSDGSGEFCETYMNYKTHVRHIADFFFHSIIGSKTSLHCLSDGSQFRRIRGSIISIYMFLRCLTHQQFGTLGIHCQRTWWITFLCFVKVPLQRLSAILGKFTTLITCRKIRYYIQHRATLSPVYNLQGFCYLHFQYIP